MLNPCACLHIYKFKLCFLMHIQIHDPEMLLSCMYNLYLGHVCHTMKLYVLRKNLLCICAHIGALYIFIAMVSSRRTYCYVLLVKHMSPNYESCILIAHYLPYSLPIYESCIPMIVQTLYSSLKHRLFCHDIYSDLC